MLRCFLLFTFFIGHLIGAANIVSLVPFGDDGLKIVVDDDIESIRLEANKLGDGREYFDIKAHLSIPKKTFIFKDNSVLTIAQNRAEVVRIVIRPTKGYEFSKDGNNIIFKTTIKINKLQKEEKNNRNVGKKIIIDPGHGGKDCGTISIDQICEKNITLSISNKLVEELKKRKYKVLTTRSKDVFIELPDRTKFANAKNADIFISIHVNSVPVGRRSPSGIETYFLSTNSSERGLQVAETENQGDIKVMNFYSKQTFLHTINNHRMIASSKLAIDIQAGMIHSVQAMHRNVIDGGVKDGPFWVLAGALMPSILVEVGYLSHAGERKLLLNEDYQLLIANGIADGVDAYFDKN